MKNKKKKVDFCPGCGKSEIGRDLQSFDPCCESRGRIEVCPVCRKTFWVPANPEEPLEEITAGDKILMEIDSSGREKEFGSAEEFTRFIDKVEKEGGHAGDDRADENYVM